jgi:ribonuclease BN (tRNA processing enzyme)
MPESATKIDLTFLGSGNAFAAEGRAFSSFLLNGRYLFDCGPTVLQQLQKAAVSSNDVDVVLISHFHADHYFGLPFLILDAWRNGRKDDFWIVGPPGIEKRTEDLFELAFPSLPNKDAFRRRYIEVSDGMEAMAAGLTFSAAEVEHVACLDCFAYRVDCSGRSLVYSGDTRLCDGLLRIVAGADVVVIECSCGCDPVHLSPADIAEVGRTASRAKLVLTHLDGQDHPENFEGLLVAEDLARFSL